MIIQVRKNAQCLNSLFANNVEPTASFNIILLFLTINFRDET